MWLHIKILGSLLTLASHANGRQLTEVKTDLEYYSQSIYEYSKPDDLSENNAQSPC